MPVSAFFPAHRAACLECRRRTSVREFPPPATSGARRTGASTSWSAPPAAHCSGKESRNGHQYHENCQRLHDAEQRYARSLHGRELEFLAEISEHHKRGQQHGQRQRHGNHGECRIEKQLGDYADLQPLAHKVVDALPEELHHYYEQADEECHGEQRQEALKHVAV